MTLEIWKQKSGMTARMLLTDLPLVDIFEKNGNLVLQAELPGIEAEDLDISMDGDSLNIKGEKKNKSKVKAEDYYKSERTYGSFFRSLPIPSTIDSSKITAEYKAGVLQVTMPQMAGANLKKVLAVVNKKTGNIEIDVTSKSVFHNGSWLRLSPKLFDLLFFLMNHRGQIFSRAYLTKQIWGEDYVGTSRTVDVRICYLRGKIEEFPHNPKHLLTQNGVGYTFVS